MSRNFEKEDVLKKEFDYYRCTKPELREIMSKLNIENIPSLYTKKNDLLLFYKEHVYDKIDELRQRELHIFNDRFCDKNIFQSSVEDNYTKNNKIDKKISSSINDKNTLQRTEPNLSMESASMHNTANLNTNSQGHKSAERSKIETTMSNKVRDIKNNKRREKLHSMLKYFGIIALAIIIIYLKFFVPYCQNGMRYCFPIPKHGYLVDEKLFCNKGYRKIISFIDYCAYDTRIEYNNKYQANKIIKTLENMKGEYTYGLRDTPRIKISEIVSDPDVMELLKKSGSLIFDEMYVEAIKYRVTLKLFVKYYIIKSLKLTIVVLGMFIFAKIMYTGRIKSQRNKEEAQNITKKVLKSLNKQAIIAMSNQSISDTVFSTQLQEVYNTKDDVWRYVENNLKENSNVESLTDDNGELKFRWVGLLFCYKDKMQDMVME
ncbi:UDP-glucose pyrophosphorylase [Enterocytozoon bieneusi H348]|nr:UDP-glucose pyrophosphorylase [Enterocytozoon bieneusi H348]|eukprot:XP_002649820.1 UDP-glucose pyrophosphorylase [Enterocytozoon bieneusi H348]